MFRRARLRVLAMKRAQLKNFFQASAARVSA
jgi:hypothetical protein